MPDFRGRMRLIGLLMAPLKSTRSAYGPHMRVRSGDYTNLAALFGFYGTELRNLILELPSDGVFVDIGANAGIYSLIAADHLTRGRVLSFKPNPRVFADLLANLELNDADNVVALNAAVGSPGGILNLAASATHSGAGHLTRMSVPGMTTRPVACLGLHQLPFLAELLRESEVLCKIDVEGAERGVLKAFAEAGVLGEVNRFYIEICAHHLDRFGSSPKDIYADLEAQGFRAAGGLRTSYSYDELFERHA
ncbi:hypothetical protein ROJ8625_00276 [Roseivivax jejudonensis]|uniref:Methyltransferase FkbM domain-containing protein n=1 Tax=Roseivivax jejudonensis TaxID=1529041 RepID=A0A1X6Y5I9_9RHOB|nr:FkbM family methyltransferase [Roseivivax jejudonensis]SLN11564.1 hypothetical protein ROJ8625_00276 [Roseivivax jejudonensis]